MILTTENLSYDQYAINNHILLGLKLFHQSLKNGFLIIEEEILDKGSLSKHSMNFRIKYSDCVQLFRNV